MRLLSLYPLIIISSIAYGFRMRSIITSTRLVNLEMASIKGGSIVALVTPMTNSNAIDYNKLIDILKWHVNEKTDGVVILGTTGESSTISADERTKIIDTSVKTINGAIPVIVGTGGIETNKVIESSKQAQSLGADGVLVITPYYVKPPQRALITHFNAIANAITIPLILYNCPGRTGVNMTPETVVELSKNKNIIGLKDAVGNIAERLGPIRSACGSTFLMYSGEDDQGCEYVRLGGDGVISVTANVAPNTMHRMLEAAKQGNKAEAESLNQSLIPLHKGLFCESNPIPVKKALQIMGKIDGGIRPPLAPMEDNYLDIIKSALKSAGSI